MMVLAVSFLFSGAFIVTALVQNWLRRRHSSPEFAHGSENAPSRGH